jgi:hypothetical protein
MRKENITITNRRTPEGPTDEGNPFLPTLEDLTERQLREERSIVFGVEAPDYTSARDQSVEGLAELFGVDASEITIDSIDKFLELRGESGGMECEGPITRYETVCWAPETPFKGSRTFDTEREAMDAMTEFLDAYKELAGRSVVDPRTRRPINFPGPEHTGFECALNEKVTKRLCDLTPGREGTTGIIWQVQGRNPNLG